MELDGTPEENGEAIMREIRLEERAAALKPAARELVRSIYDRHGAGCCMHIVTDDGNIEDRDVQHCLAFVMKNECHECIALAALLLTIPESLRDETMGMEAEG